jgi:hypothetical protein
LEYIKQAIKISQRILQAQLKAAQATTRPKFGLMMADAINLNPSHTNSAFVTSQFKQSAL